MRSQASVSGTDADCGQRVAERASDQRLAERTLCDCVQQRRCTQARFRELGVKMIIRGGRGYSMRSSPVSPDRSAEDSAAIGKFCQSARRRSDRYSLRRAPTHRDARLEINGGCNRNTCPTRGAGVFPGGIRQSGEGPPRISRTVFIHAAICPIIPDTWRSSAAFPTARVSTIGKPWPWA